MKHVADGWLKIVTPVNSTEALDGYNQTDD